MSGQLWLQQGLTSRLPAGVGRRLAPAGRLSNMDELEHTAAEAALAPAAIATLVDNHARFLAFLSTRVASREVAEEILQEAFVRALERGDALRDEEAVTAWFYRLLRNALIDHYRRTGSQQRALERVALDVQTHAEVQDTELLQTVCSCVDALVDTLKPEYAEVLKDVDRGGKSLADYAATAGITPNNATVRLHRARKAALKRLVQSCGTCATHGCLDCRCRSGAKHCD